MTNKPNEILRPDVESTGNIGQGAYQRVWVTPDILPVASLVAAQTTRKVDITRRIRIMDVYFSSKA